MKKNILSGLVLAIFFLTLSASSNPPSVQFHYKVHITDNCSGNWTQDYCVDCVIGITGGGVLCSKTICGLRAGQDEDISYKCDVPDQSSENIYYITITAYRNEPNPPCGQPHTTSGQYWSQLTDGNTVYSVTSP
jgi:hypothetical protein